MSELRKPFLKSEKKQKLKVKMPHVNNKPLANNKQKTRARMNYEWIGKTI